MAFFPHSITLMSFFVTVLILPFLLSCSHTQKDEKASAKSIYEQALKQKEKKQFMESLETLKKLKRHFIHSSYSARARLLMGDIYFEMEDYTLAEEEYKRFLKVYSRVKKDYALYQLGLRDFPIRRIGTFPMQKKPYTISVNWKTSKTPVPIKKRRKSIFIFSCPFRRKRNLKSPYFIRKEA